jgi:hypothetical protein
MLERIEKLRCAPDPTVARGSVLPNWMRRGTHAIVPGEVCCDALLVMSAFHANVTKSSHEDFLRFGQFFFFVHAHTIHQGGECMSHYL